MTISGFTDYGITVSTSDGAQLTISDSTIRDIDYIGIFTTGVGQVAIDRTRLSRSHHGLFVGWTVKATLRDTVASGNADAGFWIDYGAVATSRTAPRITTAPASPRRDPCAWPAPR